ncbi:MAG: NADH dehydrogenase subunit [Gammaproteobacteria bacterium]|jgi:formate hydrogenlyase subunit 3/multisubunit Na+/H+ antiporter MnhD subunit|nr:NADH dehydrogenase subunit [Gammaproteobacteria bacterium]
MELALLDMLGIFAVGTVILSLLVGEHVRGGQQLSLLYLLQLVIVSFMVSSSESTQFSSALTLELQGVTMSWRLDGLGLYFALITVATALFVSVYMVGAWGAHYRKQGGSLPLLHFALSLNVLTMLLLLASGDLLSLFIGWELASWSAFLLMALAGGTALKSALRYLVYAMAGAMMVFGAIAILVVEAGSFQFAAVNSALVQLEAETSLLLLLLVVAGFGVKMGLLPFHLWQASAYAETPGPGAAFLGAISSRLGLFAILLVLFKVAGGGWLNQSLAGVSSQTLLAWVAVATIIFPTFTAMRQNDARELLAWHGIGQGGYMLLGIAMMDPLGAAGGLLHVFNHATYQAALFLAVSAVIYRTGSSDLNHLGGLVVRMPLTFVTMLVGIIGLAGLPPTNGFVSKWLVYRSLLEQGEVLLFVGAVVGTLGTILSVYKLIHNSFLGSLRLEHQPIREVPWTMWLPMLLLSLIILLSGIFPGVPLQWVSAALLSIGLPVPEFNLGGVVAEGGSLDMRIISGVLFAGFAMAALIFYGMGGRSRRVNPLDNYAGGHFLYAANRYHYSNNFYAGLMHLIKPWYRGLFQRIEQAVVRLLAVAAGLVQGIYLQAQAGRMALVVTVLLLWWGSYVGQGGGGL